MLSHDTSTMVSRKGLEDFSLWKTWHSWAHSQHQLCVMLQSMELLPCPTSGFCHHGYLVQLIQLMSYNCRAWRPDPRVGGVEVQIICFPCHTQPTTYRATSTEKKLPALTRLYCQPSSLTIWSSLTVRVWPKVQEAQAIPVGQVALIFPSAFHPLHLCSDGLPLFIEEG